MRTSDRPLDFAAAAGLAVAALAIRALLQPWLGSLQPFAPGFVAIAAAVLFFGWRPAAISAVVSYMGGTYLFVQPGESTRLQDIAALMTFAMSAALIIFMGQRARKAEQDLAEANLQLRDADRKKDQFLATLSHELRNPIGVISTAAAVLERGEHEPSRRTAISVIARQAAQIRRLVEDLLDVGRITRGRMTLHAAPVDVRSCVEHAVEGAQDAVAGKQQSLIVAVPAEPVEMDADHARIVQVLSNLIDNASKYSPAQAQIVVRVENGDDVRIEVTDDGPGIDQGVLPHVFDIFDQGGPSASGGLGLGLGICKRIVEMHRGTIRAEPNPLGKGTSFVILLPRAVTRTNNRPSASGASASVDLA